MTVHIRPINSSRYNCSGKRNVCRLLPVRRRNRSDYARHVGVRSTIPKPTSSTCAGRYRISILTLLALAVFLHAAMPAAAASTARPNILLITADDLGFQLSSYGDEQAATPHLDALAAAGARFTRAYVTQASCSSSRASILTSLYPHQNGQYGLAHFGFRMHEGQNNLVAMLKASGYHTGIIGKLHVQPAAAFPFDWRKFFPGVSGVRRTRHVRLVAEHSRDFFATSKPSGRPFFFSVNYLDPHDPFTDDLAQVDGLPEARLDPEKIEPLPLRKPDEQERKRQTAILYDYIARLDAGIGMLLDELAAAGLADNTLVIFVSDNGPPVIRGKTTAYEQGVQIPLFVRWPGKVTKGQVRDELVSTVDIMPTILQAAGIPIPDGLGGRPLQPLLQGDSPDTWRKHLFTEANFHLASMYRPQRAVRDDRFKLVLNLDPTPAKNHWVPVELFDLRTNREELPHLNLVDDLKYAEQLKRLKNALRQWQEETGDPLADPARRERWLQAGKEWEKIGAKQVPNGELERLE